MTNRAVAGYIWCGECRRDDADWLAWIQWTGEGEYWLYRRPPGYELWRKKDHPGLRRNMFSANLTTIWAGQLIAPIELPVTCSVHGTKELDLKALEVAIKTRRPTRPAAFVV